MCDLSETSLLTQMVQHLTEPVLLFYKLFLFERCTQMSRLRDNKVLLYCIVLYCIVLYCIALHCIALHCIALHCIALHCIALHCIALYCIVLYCIVLYCIVLYCIVLYCIAHPLLSRRFSAVFKAAKSMCNPPNIAIDINISFW